MSHYDTSGPSSPIRFEYSGHRLYVEPSGYDGMHTGRGKFTVICLSCGEIVHPNTTGPSSWIRGHVGRGAPSFRHVAT